MKRQKKQTLMHAMNFFMTEFQAQSTSLFEFAGKEFATIGRGALVAAFQYKCLSKKIFEPLLVYFSQSALLNQFEYFPVHNMVRSYDPKNAFVILIAIEMSPGNSMMKSSMFGADAFQLVKTTYNENNIQRKGRVEIMRAFDAPSKVVPSKDIKVVPSKDMQQKDLPPKECSQCQTKNVALLLCGKCKALRYCSKTCQIVHWKSGHKLTCGQHLIVQK